MLSEYNQSAKLLGLLPDKAGVFAEPLYVTLVASVKEYRTARALPVFVRDYVALLISVHLVKSEVIDILSEKIELTAEVEKF